MSSASRTLTGILHHPVHGTRILQFFINSSVFMALAFVFTFAVYP